LRNIHLQLFQYGLVFVFLTSILFRSLIILTTCDPLFICENMPDTMYAQSISYYMLVLRYSNRFRLSEIRNHSLFSLIFGLWIHENFRRSSNQIIPTNNHFNRPVRINLKKKKQFLTNLSVPLFFKVDTDYPF
jgi:hypothetical protein